MHRKLLWLVTPYFNSFFITRISILVYCFKVSLYFLVSLFVSYYHTPQEFIWIKWTRHIYMKSFRTYALLRQCICVSATWDELSCHDNLIVFIFTESSFLFCYIYPWYVTKKIHAIPYEVLFKTVSSVVLAL